MKQLEPGIRMFRVNRLLQRVLAQALQEADFLFGAGSFVTVSKVDVSPDLRVADVYVRVTSIAGHKAKDTADVLEKLRGEAGALSRLVGRAVRLKRTPRLRFKVDTQLEEDFRIDDLLRQASESNGVCSR